MMVVGFIEFGRALMVQQVLINASRVGARQAITTGATQTEVTSAVEDYTAALAVPGVNVSVTPNPADADPGDPDQRYYIGRFQRCQLDGLSLVPGRRNALGQFGDA